MRALLPLGQVIDDRVGFRLFDECATPFSNGEKTTSTITGCETASAPRDAGAKNNVGNHIDAGKDSGFRLQASRYVV
jgi:hypothetical protein